MNHPIEFVLESAQGVAEGRYAPMYKRDDYEDAMLEIAKRDARPGESSAVAFARLCEEGDSRVESLYVAARRAEHDDARDRVLKGVDDRLSVRRKLMDDMLARAEKERQKGETSEQAFVRLLESDAEMGKLYAKHLGR